MASKLDSHNYQTVWAYIGHITDLYVIVRMWQYCPSTMLCIVLTDSFILVKRLKERIALHG